MSIDTHPCATSSRRRPRRPFALGALFLACGVSLGMLASLTAVGVAALLVPDASAAIEPVPAARHALPTAAPIAKSPRAREAAARVDLVRAPMRIDDSEPDVRVRRKLRRVAPGAALAQRAAEVETSSTLAALVAADDRARASRH